MMRKQTDEVLASARKDLQAQLAVVREEMSRLAAEEQALTHALSSLDGESASSSSAAPATDESGRNRTANKSATRSPTRKPRTSRRGRQGGGSKPTAERVKELRQLLADGPKSRNDLAAALKVSPARVQQLLAELGKAVSSQPDPEQSQGKLWSLKQNDGAATAAKPRTKGSSGKAKRRSSRRSTARPKGAAR